MQKTLGGDRLGAGKKMQVHLHNYERSTHDLGYLWRSTMSPGTLVPFLSEVALPGDTFDINLEADFKTHPTIGPLFGSYKCQFDVFLAPMRLYNGKLHNNALGIGMDIASVKFPLARFTGADVDPDVVADLDNAQIDPSSLPAYFGLRGVGIKKDGGAITRDFNAIPFLAYWDIYKNYYANKQEGIGAVIHSTPPGVYNGVLDFQLIGLALPEFPTTGTAISLNSASTEIQINWDPLVGAFDPSTIYLIDVGGNNFNLYDILVPGSLNNGGGGGVYVGQYNWALYGDNVFTNWRYASNGDAIPIAPQVSTFDLDNIDDMRNFILENVTSSTAILINDLNKAPYSWLVGVGGGSRPNIMNTQEGLGLKTYQSDLFNNWLDTEWIDGPNGVSALSAIDVSGGELTIDAFLIGKKVYDMLNRIAVSGGSYDDWIDAQYAHEKFRLLSTPMYMGGLSKELVFQEVVSNSQSEEQPLGTLAGRGVMAKKHKGGYVRIKVDEPSYIIGIVSLTPRIDYSQGNKWDMHLRTMADLHVPGLDGIGFQDLITEQMAWWDSYYDTATSTWVQNSAGKQPAWINYMTNTNRVLGNFAKRDNEMFMTLNRRYDYEYSGGKFQLADLTTYIDPVKFNNIFAQTSLDAQNFWAQIAVDIEARRKMSARMIPNM